VTEVFAEQLSEVIWERSPREVSVLVVCARLQRVDGISESIRRAAFLSEIAFLGLIRVTDGIIARAVPFTTIEAKKSQRDGERVISPEKKIPRGDFSRRFVCW
jgi:hypothetical protein